MQAERWLPPLTGALATASALAVVAVYAYGRSLAPEHEATVEATLGVEVDVAWALISDPAARVGWVPDVVQVVPGDVRGVPAWRELDAGGDRFDFHVVTSERPVFAIEAARPEDIGMVGRWTWTVEPDGPGTRVRVTEQGEIVNAVWRGWWALTTGPYQSIEEQLVAFGRALGDPIERADVRRVSD